MVQVLGDVPHDLPQRLHTLGPGDRRIELVDEAVEVRGDVPRVVAADEPVFRQWGERAPQPTQARRRIRLAHQAEAGERCNVLAVDDSLRRNEQRLRRYAQVRPHIRQRHDGIFGDALAI